MPNIETKINYIIEKFYETHHQQMPNTVIANKKKPAS